MNFFLKGDFKIQESWQQKPASRASNSREKSKDKDKNSSLVNAGKNILAEPSTDLLDDQISKKILKDFAAEVPSSAKTDKKNQKKEESFGKLPPKQKPPTLPQSDNDLLTSMAARLQAVEKTCKNQREEIKQKSQELQKLKSENTFLKAYRDDANKQYEKMKALEAENSEMKKKVEQMQAYLKKYGLKWVGNKIDGKLQHEQIKKDIKQTYNYRLPSEIDINTILRRAEELNAGLHSQGMGTEVYQENGVHKFRKADALPVGFFANGIAIKGYKFFPYKSKESLQILGDFIDGYFPYILKAKYPNGVFLKIVDKVAEKYLNQSSSQVISTFESSDTKDFKPPSKEQFLSKLPKQVIKNGKVINIRGEIQKRLNGQADKQIKQQAQEEESQIFQRIQGARVFKTEANSQLEANKLTELECCTIKIRNQQGEVFILRLAKESNIKQIYSWMGKVTKGSFKLMSNFPRRTYEVDQKQDLEELGFCPNAMLHIQSSASK